MVGDEYLTESDSKVAIMRRRGSGEAGHHMFSTKRGGGKSCLSHIPVDAGLRSRALVMHSSTSANQTSKIRPPSAALLAEIQEGLMAYNAGRPGSRR